MAKEYANSSWETDYRLRRFASARCGCSVGQLFEAIVQWGKFYRPVSASESLGKEVVGEGGVLREERPVQVAAVGRLVDGPFRAVFAVVATADDRFAEWRAARPKEGQA